MSDYAINTAARFGDIPFVEFTKELVTGVFDSLVESHLLQMEEYANFVNSLAQTLSTYINNTQDGVTFDQISDFILNFELPELLDPSNDIATVLEKLDSPDTSSPGLASAQTATEESTWWGKLIDTLAPAVIGLVDKIEDPSEKLKFDALVDYNESVLSGADILAENVPTYKQIHDAIAALIVSNKYSLLQTMAKQGMMRLVVTEGEIETKITFSTWNSTSSGSERSYKIKNKHKVKTKYKNKGLARYFKEKRKRKTTNRTVTVNTAKSYQRDSSGTSVNIFGRVLVRFKTDYAPLNG